MLIEVRCNIICLAFSSSPHDSHLGMKTKKQLGEE